ncbi:MAG: hypothetical protein RCG15_08465 [Candidatus Rickettsia vulgarisii]
MMTLFNKKLAHKLLASTLLSSLLNIPSSFAAKEVVLTGNSSSPVGVSFNNGDTIKFY